MSSGLAGHDLSSLALGAPLPIPSHETAPTTTTEHSPTVPVIDRNDAAPAPAVEAPSGAISGGKTVSPPTTSATPSQTAAADMTHPKAVEIEGHPSESDRIGARLDEDAEKIQKRQELIDHVQDPTVGIQHPLNPPSSSILDQDLSKSSSSPSSLDNSTPHPDSISHTVHIPNTTAPNTHPSVQTSVIPATQSHLSPNHSLPTAPNVHPSSQEAALQNGGIDPDLVAGEVEKAKAGRRELMGKKAKGTIVEGIEDDRLYALLRRFDVQVTHALISMSGTVHPNEPDLRRSTLPSIPYNNDVLKSNIERIYATLGIIIIRLINEIARLRSWSPEERYRTSLFCGVYFLSWIFGMAIPVLVGFFIVLVVSEESRGFFFPVVMPPDGMAPSATDPTNRKGDESLLGGVDTEVQHRSKSEQVEEQAWEFRQLAESFAVKMAVARGRKSTQGNAEVGVKDHAGDDDDSSSSSDEEDPDALPPGPGGIDPSLYAPGEHPLEVENAQRRSQRLPEINAKGDVVGKEKDGSQGMNGKMELVKHDSKTGEKVMKPMNEKKRKKLEAREAKAKRDQLIGKYTKAAQDGMGDTADVLECLANALSPPPPFPHTLARYKLAGAILVPIMLATAIVPSWIWARSASFGLGFGFFGQPLIDRGLKFVSQKVPNWRELLDMRNSLLSGVPTNDQLVLHLLRVGERAHQPLPRPPPPPLAGTPKEQIKDNAPTPDDNLVDSDGEPIEVDELSKGEQIKHKTKSKFASTFKGFTKRVAGIGADVTVDGTKKKIGTTVDRIVFGGLLKDDGDSETYPCKLDKKVGHLYLEPTALTGGPAIVSFQGLHSVHPEFERSVNDLVEIKKGGISIPRAALGWVSGADIESQTLYLRFLSKNQRRANRMAREAKQLESEEGDIYVLHAMVRREQAFVRLLSMGGSQRWESI